MITTPERVARPYIIDLDDVALLSEEVPIHTDSAVPQLYVLGHPVFELIHSGKVVFSTHEDTAYFKALENIGTDLLKHEAELEFTTTISDINSGRLGSVVVLASRDEYPLALRNIFSGGGESQAKITHHNQHIFGEMLQIDGPGSLKLQRYNPIFYNNFVTYLDLRSPSLVDNLELLIGIVQGADLPNGFKQERDIAFLTAIRSAALEDNVAPVSPFRQYEQFLDESYKKENTARALARLALKQ